MSEIEGYGPDFEGELHIEDLPEGWTKLNEIEGHMALYEHEESGRQITFVHPDYAQRKGNYEAATVIPHKVEDVAMSREDREFVKTSIEHMMETFTKLWDNKSFRERFNARNR